MSRDEGVRHAMGWQKKRGRTNRECQIQQGQSRRGGDSDTRMLARGPKRRHQSRIGVIVDPSPRKPLTLVGTRRDHHGSRSAATRIPADSRSEGNMSVEKLSDGQFIAARTGIWGAEG